MEKKNIIVKIGDVFCEVEAFVMDILFIAMLGILLGQVICRYVPNAPLAWADEMSTYVYIAVSWIGAIVAVRERSHIQIDVLPSVMAKLIKNEDKYRNTMDALDIFAQVVQVAFFILLMVWMLTYTKQIADKGTLTAATMLPMWWMMSPICISLVLMAFHAVLNTVESIIEIVNTSKKIKLERKEANA